ncbi:hypothetical protein [Marinitoga sp. 38H-ov]|uniref:hypothetical protein n=1 Tax=Marinitoga sp. 38H-ov TaxID=1755814 RepID=UPI0013EA489E|nr:hypothetical protein [Marinitoga sp. 38H-ov]
MTIINLSIYPYSVLSDNLFFEGYKIFEIYNLNESFLLKGFGIPFILNKSNLKYKKSDAIIIYKDDFRKISFDNHNIYSQHKSIENLNKIIFFFNKYNIKLPKDIYIYNLNYSQAFYLLPNNFFLKNEDIANGIIVHELSHYMFGYIIKRKNEKDIWPEILCEALRLKYLFEYDLDLYYKVIERKKIENNIYSKILDYPLLLNNFEEFLRKVFEYNNLSDHEFNKIYNSLERGAYN